jgi:hypothetical protein
VIEVGLKEAWWELVIEMGVGRAAELVLEGGLML